MKIKFSNDQGYLVLSVVFLVISICTLLFSSYFDQYQLLLQVIAALLSAIVTVLITRLLLKKQTESNKEIIYLQAEKEAIANFNQEIIKDRMQYAHEYLNTIYFIIQDEKITKSELFHIEIQLNHILLNAVAMDDDTLNVAIIQQVANHTKNILTSIQQGKNDYHKELLLLTNNLYQGLYGYFGIDYSEDENTQNIAETFESIFSMIE